MATHIRSIRNTTKQILLALIIGMTCIPSQKGWSQCCNYIDSGQAIDTLPTFGVALGDIDNDGDADAMTIEAYSKINVFKNNGSGVFSINQSIIPASGEWNNYGVYLINVDTDNDLDAIVIPFYNDASLKIYKNNGAGNFSLFQAVSSSLGCHYAGIADIDNDGDVDVMLAGWMSATTKVFKNNGSGTFSLFSSLSLVNFGSSNDIALADYDGDTDIDAVVVSSSQGGRLLLNDGVGNFTDSGITIGNTSDNYTCCASADVDKDGTADLIFGTMYSTLSVLKNDGTGNFTLFFSAPSGNYDKHIRVVDQDYDGAPDIFVSNYGSNGLEVWSNDGEGNLSLCYTNASPMPQTYSHGFDVGLLNGDAYYDTFMGYFGGDGDKVFFGDPLFYANTVSASICQGETYVFPDGTTSTQSGTHISQFFGVNGCDSVINTILTVIPVDTLVTAGLNSLSSAATAASFQWVDCNTNYAWISGQTSAVFTPGISGSYALIVQQNGCIDTSACHTIIISGIQKVEEQPFSIYPNPVTDELNLKSEIRFEFAEIIISDALGRVCLNINAIFNTELKMDVSALSPGYYSFVIKSVNGKEFRTKFLK